MALRKGGGSEVLEAGWCYLWCEEDTTPLGMVNEGVVVVLRRVIEE